MCEKALTVGELARRLRCPVHKIEYLARSRGLRPIQRAGNARVFSAEDMDRIALEIRRINATKGGR